MMSEYFTLFTYTPWDGLRTNELTQVKVLSLKSVFKTFPVIESSFFDDLMSNTNNHAHYSYQECIKRVIGPNNEDYDISNWNFVWAYDDQNRIFQFLFQKEKEQGILVAIAPPELVKLFSDHGKSAVLRTLSLLNSPSKIKFLMILAPKGKSIAQERQMFQVNRKQIEKLKFINALQNTPNIAGQWFPQFKPKCPNCNTILVDLKDYNIGFGQLICPNCGYPKKNLKKSKQ